MLWNNDISLILLKMSSKYKAQVALLLTELLTEIFIILYIEALTSEISQIDILESYLVLSIKSQESIT